VVKSITAFDGSKAMLDIAIAKLQKGGFSNWRAEVADNRTIPVPDASADIAIEGWSFGHFQGWYPDSWREEAGKALAEMQRVLRPGGTAILLETMGTGRETPKPPTPGLADFFAWLEDRQGFSSTWIRTDYKFDSLAETEQLTRFFFGDELANTALAKHWVILPECTGIWWKTF
jgi:ubiquinone/menaquinone biosynthesis C-methylase UbiE